MSIPVHMHKFMNIHTNPGPHLSLDMLRVYAVITSLAGGNCLNNQSKVKKQNVLVIAWELKSHQLVKLSLYPQHYPAVKWVCSFDWDRRNHQVCLIPNNDGPYSNSGFHTIYGWRYTQWSCECLAKYMYYISVQLKIAGNNINASIHITTSNWFPAWW